MKELIVFKASWCGPCKQLSPNIDEVEAQGAIVTRVDIDDNPDMVDKYNVRGVPTVVFLKDDQEVPETRFSGLRGAADILDTYAAL